MSRQPGNSNDATGADKTEPDDYGSMSVEDEPGGTVDPGDLAGTAECDDAEVGYQPESSQADGEDS